MTLTANLTQERKEMTSERSEDSLKEYEINHKSEKTKLAWLMLSGFGGEEVDEDQAVVLLEERVRDRDAEAMWMLGLCYEYGIGTEQDIERASSLYMKSSQQGNEMAKNLESMQRGTEELILNCLFLCFYVCLIAV